MQIHEREKESEIFMNRKGNRLLMLTAVVCVLSLVVMTLALIYSSRRGQADFVPPVFDTAARSGVPEVPEGLGWQELDAQVFKVSICGLLVPMQDAVDVWLTNPEENEIWLKLRILDEEGSVLGETGLVRPGEYVQSVALETVPKSGTAVALKLMAYEPETYHSAGTITLNTTIQ